MNVFCQGCGSQLDDSARFCTACGRPVQVSSASVAPLPVQSLAAQVRVLGILWAIYGSFQILMAFWTVSMSSLYLSVFQDIVSRDPNFPVSLTPFLRQIFIWSAIFAFLAGALAVFGGWALLRRDPSGRVTALIAAFVSLISIPLGTGLGIYTLIVLMPASARERYARLTATGQQSTAR